MKFLQLVLFCLISNLSFAQTAQTRYDVSFNGDKIGTLTASRTIAGSNETIDVKTNTNAKILVMSVHVESEINLHKEQFVMKTGIAYRHSNRGSENIAGYTKKLGNKYVTKINNKTDTIYRQRITFCVADLYFKEPKELAEVYSNMYGSFVKITNMGNHRYRFTTPDGKLNTYTYVNGQLNSIEVELSIGKVVSKRVSG